MHSGHHFPIILLIAYAVFVPSSGTTNLSGPEPIKYFQNFIFEIIFLWFFTPFLDVLLLALWRRGEQSLRAARINHFLLVFHFLLGTKNPKKNETKIEVLKVHPGSVKAKLQRSLTGRAPASRSS